MATRVLSLIFFAMLGAAAVTDVEKELRAQQ
jgi:hypothetical protein